MSTSESPGVTLSEQYLNRLASRSFLSLWSYPGVYRDQGQTTTQKVGKEVCDLLVVFQDHILIFSDKHCEFPKSGNIDTDWPRWFRKAIWDSAKQIYGAERWIKAHPDRLFLDKGCTQPFPVSLPDPSAAKVHRIVVAHGVSTACEEYFGGGSSGSLVVDSTIIGSDHYTPEATNYAPFCVGHIDPTKGYIHVLDDTTLNIVLETLDTVRDFVTYLEKKEAFLSGGPVVHAPGEEELLAFYLQKLNRENEHDFVIPRDLNFVLLDEGFWDDFTRSPERLSQTQADRVSYFWDALIENFTAHLLRGTRYEFDDGPVLASFQDTERALRFLAAESRTRRRMLSEAFLEVIAKTPRDQRALRVLLPNHAEEPYYIFVAFPLPDPSWRNASDDDYRRVRVHFLHACCLVARLRFPVATDIIGIATEPGTDNRLRSEDILYLDGRFWNEEMEQEALRLQQALEILVNPDISYGSYMEYPSETSKKLGLPSRRSKFDIKGRDRNAPCVCGSGRKLKKCCGPKLRP